MPSTLISCPPSATGPRPVRPLLLAALLLALASPAGAAITGTVYRDFDADGARNGGEPGVAGVEVRAFDATGTLVGGSPQVTGADGSYTLGGTLPPVRIEFRLPPALAFLRPGPAGPDSATTVTFADDGAVVDLAVGRPGQFCQELPDLATPCYISGDPLGGGDAGQQDVLVSFPYDPPSATSPPPITLATGAQLGSTWGLAFQRGTRTLLVGAMLKRHMGFGPLGPGGLYAVDLSGGAPVVTPFVDLATLGVDPGVDPRTLPGDPGLPPDMNTPNHDPNAWDAVGKVGLGDIDLSDDERTLWVLSLGDRTLYQVFVDLPLQIPGAGDVTAHPVPDPGCAGGDYRPWALAVHDGRVFVGVVCSAQTSQQAADLAAHVLALDPADPGAGFISVFSFPLTYPRGCVSVSGANCAPATWLPWIDEFTDIPNPRVVFNQTIHPQPILADIEFDDDGSMILGFIDRLGHQVGNANFSTDPADMTTYEGASGGDLLRVCNDGGTFVLESDGACPGGPPTAGQGNGQGPGGGEYYWSEMFPASNTPTTGSHHETLIGGLVHVPGRGEVVSTLFDPVVVRSGGAGWFDHLSGDDNTRYQVFGMDQGGFPATFGKAAGLGDLAALCDPAPLEIGNRVWCDDGTVNGVQDPGEPPLAGVTVELACGATVATTTTAADGTYRFHGGNVPGGGLPTGTACTLTIDLVANAAALGTCHRPTAANAGDPADPGQDLRDSDGQETTPGRVTIDLTTGDPGDNDHTFDFGFVRLVPQVTATKTDGLLLDADGDGMADAGDTLRYTVVVTNGGTDDATGVVFASGLDPATALVAGSVTTSQGTVTSGNGAGDTAVAVALGTLAAGGGSAAITFDVAIADPLPPGVVQLTCQGTASGDNFPDTPTDDPDSATPGDPTTTPLDFDPQMVVFKESQQVVDNDGDGALDPGDGLLYTVTLINTGDGPATDVVMSDTPDPNTTLVVGSVTTSQGTVTFGNNPGDITVEVALGTLAAGGGTATVTFEVTVNDPLGPGVVLLLNRATVTGTDFPPTTSDNPATGDPGDPTIDPVEGTPVIDVPTLSAAGLAAMGALLLVLGLAVLRRRARA
jgi:uncharacterized repeat protein (TIGR01451 family)